MPGPPAPHLDEAVPGPPAPHLDVATPVPGPPAPHLDTVDDTFPVPTEYDADVQHGKIEDMDAIIQQAMSEGIF